MYVGNWWFSCVVSTLNKHKSEPLVHLIDSPQLSKTVCCTGSTPFVIIFLMMMNHGLYFAVYINYVCACLLESHDIKHVICEQHLRALSSLPRRDVDGTLFLSHRILCGERQDNIFINWCATCSPVWCFPSKSTTCCEKVMWQVLLCRIRKRWLCRIKDCLPTNQVDRGKRCGENREDAFVGTGKSSSFFFASALVFSTAAPYSDYGRISLALCSGSRPTICMP